MIILHRFQRAISLSTDIFEAVTIEKIERRKRGTRYERITLLFERVRRTTINQVRLGEWKEDYIMYKKYFSNGMIKVDLSLVYGYIT